MIKVFLVVLCFVFSSCTKSEKEKNCLRINLSSEPTSLDPICCRNLSSLFLARHLHEGLFRYEGETLVNALAKSCEISSDGFVYRIFLKEAYFNNGSKITAHDFVCAIKRALSPETKSDYAHLLFVIKNAKDIKTQGHSDSALGVRALADDCIEYTLECPNFDFCSLLTQPIFFPTKYENGTLCYSGPFVLKSHKIANLITLEKNQTYFDAQNVHLLKIEGYFLSNDTACALFKKKELDFIGSPLGAIPAEVLPSLNKAKKLYKNPWLAVCFIRINTDKPYLNDVTFRQNLNFAINKKRLLTQALFGHHESIDSYVPALLGLSARNVLNTSIEIKKTNNNDNAALKLKFSSSDIRMQNVACVVKNDLEAALGIKVELTPRESKMLLQDLKDHDYDLMIGSWIADIKDPENFLELFSEKSLLVNGTGWESERYKELLKNAKDEPKNKMAHLEEAQNILLASRPIIPLFQFNLIYAKDQNLEDYSLNSLGILDFKKAKI